MEAHTDIIQPPLYSVIHNEKEKIYIVVVRRKEKLDGKSFELLVTNEDTTRFQRKIFKERQVCHFADSNTDTPKIISTNEYFHYVTT